MSDIHDEGHIHSGCEEPPNSESRLRGEPLDLASEIALRCGFDDGDAIDAVRIVVSEGWRSPMDFDALLAENKALQAKLNEYDKYVAATTVAALYVEKEGAYFGLPGVDPWDEERDARSYAGPWPVVAHPPCNRWCQLAFLNQAVNGLLVGDDGGTFEAALDAVRTWGGVLEHPAHSHAWAKFDLPKPPESGWQRTFCGGWVTRVDQGAYGHRGNKPTWLYAVVDDPPAMNWQRSDKDAGWWIGKGPGDTGKPRNAARRLRRENASKSPPEFRDALLGIARSTRLEVAA